MQGSCPKLDLQPGSQLLMPSQYLWAACHRTSLKQGPSPRHHSPLPLSSASSCRDSPPTALPKPCLPGPSRSPGVPRRQAVFGKPSNFSGARPPSPPKPIHCCVCPQRPLRESALVFIFPPAAPRTSVRLGSSFFPGQYLHPGPPLQSLQSLLHLSLAHI